MKYNFKITAILLIMFFVTQLIGLAVIHANPLKIEQESVNGTLEEVSNPALSWIDPPEPETNKDFTNLFWQIIIAFIIAIIVLLLLMKFKIEIFLRAWFFAVIVIALFISIVAIEKLLPSVIPFNTAMITAFVLATVLAFFKIIRRNMLVHNITELFVYPGIAVVFIPILNFYTVILLLILISIYDMWAVWHSGVMQKMAKFQINNLKIFSGFFVPYLGDKEKKKLEKLRKKYKNDKSKLKNKKISLNMAILGGGDVVFPIILAGVVLRSVGFVNALMVSIFATLSLLYLFITAKKGKFYPAMPFLTAGCLAGLSVGYLIPLIF